MVVGRLDDRDFSLGEIVINHSPRSGHIFTCLDLKQLLIFSIILKSFSFILLKLYSIIACLKYHIVCLT